jgi:choline-sulfatase
MPFPPEKMSAALILMGAALAVSCNSGRTVEKPESAGSNSLRPLNVLLVTIDTLRADHVHCYGYTQIETPAIDGLASRGVLFENAVAQTPLTPPSHASIFTGQYPTVHHVRNTGGFILQSSARPLARILQEQGWDTGAFVSSAVLKKIFGFGNGFAVYDDQMPKTAKGPDNGDSPERRGGDTVDRAIEWLKGRSGKPYFLWVHLYDPHLPYSLTDEFREKYRNAPYDGEIAYADQQLGRLMSAASSKSGMDKTIVAVLADHGESLGEHGEYSHGVFLYDATLRIPFIIAGPGVSTGVRVKQQARTIDFLPTILDLVGAKLPGNVQGSSLVPTFAGKSVPTDISYEETLYPKMNMGWAELTGIRTHQWKYIRAPRSELYDLSSDPGELRNVIQEHPAEVQRMEAQLKKIVSINPAGGKSEKVETTMVDERVMDQLKSLGYLSGFAGRTVELNGRGPDPKDRVGILKLMSIADSGSRVSPARQLETVRQALNEDPMNPSLYWELGARYEKAGRYADALKLYENALSRGIDNGRLHSRIADLSLRQGDKDRAIAEYEKAAQFNPADLESQTNLGTAYLEKGRRTEAERVFQWILANDSTYSAAQNGLGLIAIQNGNPSAARGYFERAVELDPDLVEPQMNLGLIYEMSGDNAKARDHFRAFLAKASPAQYAAIIPKVKQELAKLQ